MRGARLLRSRLRGTRLLAPPHPVAVARCVTVLVAAAALGAPPAARADYGPAQLLSYSGSQEFTDASWPAAAAGGEYVAFQGTLAGVTGVWRRDLQTGELDLVAGTDTTNAAISAPDATAPSISASGQYVAFTTTADLDPSDEPAADAGCPEVYVRNMDVAAGEPGAYILASALDGSPTGITFAGGCSGDSVGSPVGAQATPAVALSGDGSEVVFTVLSASNLGTGGDTTSTDASQVVVRDIFSDTTTVVSVTPSGEPTPGGGAYPATLTPATGYNPFTAVGSNFPTYPPTASTAAISADGTTVAWLGTNVPSQVPSATDVVPGMQSLGDVPDPAGQEVEPLWRRIADGASATTVRLLAGAGLDFYAPTYQDSNPPYAVMGGSQAAGYLPVALSADGTAVAVLADAPTPAADQALEETGVPGTPLPTDAYLVNVDDDPGSVPQVTPLTQVPDYDGIAAETGGIYGVAISPDGTQVAFDTWRTEFSPLAVITPPTLYDQTELTYVADAANGTIQLATTTYDGSPAGGDAGAVAFAADGQSLVVASQADNLFYGDVDPTSSQVYLVPSTAGATAVAPVTVAPLPAFATPAAAWTLIASATGRRDGSVRVAVSVPGAGTLTATAAAQLASASRHGRRAKLVRATVARARSVAHAVRSLTLTLTPAKRFRAMVRRRDGLYALVTLRFTAKGHKPLTRRLPVTFHATAKAAKRAKKAKHPKKAPRR